MREPVLRARGVSKHFGGAPALDDVSIELYAGRVTGLIGANGAGKTTLIRILTGLLRPDGGAVARTPDTASAPPLGYLPEERGLYARQRPLRTLRYLAQLRGMSDSDAEAAASSWLERVGLDPRDRRRLEHLSKGQQQKAQLAAAFLGDPDVIVLDEPFSGLDPINVQVVKALVDAARMRGAAVLLSAHQLNLVHAICDDVVMLAGGRVVIAETLDVHHDAGSLERLFLERATGAGASQ
jgi:ABC-2 type transport system ATP-binding protein